MRAQEVTRAARAEIDAAHAKYGNVRSALLVASLATWESELLVDGGLQACDIAHVTAEELDDLEVISSHTQLCDLCDEGSMKWSSGISSWLSSAFFVFLCWLLQVNSWEQEMAFFPQVPEPQLSSRHTAGLCVHAHVFVVILCSLVLTSFQTGLGCVAQRHRRRRAGRNWRPAGTARWTCPRHSAAAVLHG